MGFNSGFKRLICVYSHLKLVMTAAHCRHVIDSLKFNVIPKTALLTLYGMCFDLQGHNSTERTVGQGRPLQAGRLWIVPSWNIYTVEDNRQVWD